MDNRETHYSESSFIPEHLIALIHVLSENQKHRT